MQDDFGKFFAIIRRIDRLSFLLFLNSRASCILGILHGSQQWTMDLSKHESLKANQNKWNYATHNLINLFC